MNLYILCPQMTFVIVSIQLSANGFVAFVHIWNASVPTTADIWPPADLAAELMNI